MKSKIGIVGFGVVGKSALRFFDRRSIACSVWDQRDSKISLEAFLESHEKVVVSPGVDLRPYEKYREKFVCELDLFSQDFSKKTIAITGSLGKTSVTRLIDNLLPCTSICAGNIGYPMLDVVDSSLYDFVLLELSSFQLERSRIFAPDLAVWTNFYPNHLDRHSTMKDYFDAKWALFAGQTANQKAIFPLSLIEGEHGGWLREKLKTYKGEYAFCYRKNNVLFLDKKKVCDLADLPDHGFEQNMLLALGALSSFGFDCDLSSLKGLPSGKHRLEKFLTRNNVDFYNDSKATVMHATMAAVNRLAIANRPIILVLGGLSKGIDRTPLSKFVAKQNLIKKVLCLGGVIEGFEHCERYSSISELAHAILLSVSPGDQVLFSPSGSSFDLFKNYEERGELFKREIVIAQ